MFRLFITDHRGNTHRISLAQLNQMDLSSRESDAAKELRKRAALYGIVLGAVVITAATGMYQAIAPGLGLPIGGWRGLFVQIAITTPFVLFTGMLIMPRIARARSGRLVSALLAESRCGRCAQPLDGLEPEPDGCTVCPECGAAWKLN